MISSGRCPTFQLNVVDSNRVVATLKLLEAPSILQTYTKRKDSPFKTLFSGMPPPISMRRIEDCARECLQPDKQRWCTTILFCERPIDTSCYLMSSQYPSDWGKPVHDDPDEVSCEGYDSEYSRLKMIEWSPTIVKHCNPG